MISNEPILDALFTQPIRTQGFFIPIIFILFFSARIKRLIGWDAALLFTYHQVFCILQFIVPFVYWNGFGDVALATMGSISSGSAFYALAIISPLLFMSSIEIGGTSILIFLILLDATGMIFRTLFFDGPYFLMDNGAMDASFIACFLPLLIVRHPKAINIVAIGACVVAIVLTKSSTGVAAMIIGLSLVYLRHYKFTREHFLIGPGLLLLACASIMYVGPQLLKDEGRFSIWKLSMGWWWEHAPKVFGLGPGSAFLYVPGLEVSNAYHNIVPPGTAITPALQAQLDSTVISGFYWMHNEWLQTLFELGFLGLGLAWVFFLRSLRRAWQNPRLFAALTTWGFVCCLQFPLRLGISAAASAILFHQVWLSPQRIQPLE